MAVLAFAAAGAWLAPAGYAAIGWTIGSAVGQVVTNRHHNVDEQGPRLSDLSVQTSTDGAPLMKLSGVGRVPGNLIWTAGIKETSHVSSQNVGGKGGGGTTVNTTSYTYSASFACSLGAGPIIGVRRIWADGKLIFDIGTTAPPSSIVAAAAVSNGMTLYLGDETQQPDPLIESYEGTGNVPAYRGQAYVVFEDFQLANYGNRIPNLTFEPITAGGYVGYSLVSSTEVDILPISNNYYRQQAPYADELGVHLLSIEGSTIHHHVQTWDGDLIHIEDKGIAYSAFGGGIDVSASTTPMKGSSDEPGTCWSNLTDTGNSIAYVGPSGVFNLGIFDGLVHTWAYSKKGDDLWVVNVKSSAPQIYSRRHGSISYPTYTTTSFPYVDITDSYVYVWADVLMQFDRNTGAYIQQFTTPTGIINSYNVGGAKAIADDLIRYIDTGNQYVYTWTPSTGAIVQSPSGLSLNSIDVYKPQSHDDGWQMFEINGAYAIWSSVYSLATKVGVWTNQLGAGAVNLSDLVTDICTDAGLTAGDIDVTQLADTVDGYIITQPMPARAALQQLMRGFWFDAVESDYQVKFVPRGGASAVTIAEDDLAAHQFGDKLPDAIPIQRNADLELPRELIVLYIDPAADYQQGSQSARRLITGANSSNTIELPIVMSADRARQVAEVLLADAWNARSTYPLNLPPKYADLEPTDVITLQGDTATHVVRLQEFEIGANGLIQARGVAANSASYISAATGAVPAIPSQSLTTIGPTNLQLLDIPPLRDYDDAAGFYLAVCGYLGGWKGAVIEQSSDSGESWTGIASKTSAAVIGYTTDVLASGEVRLWDRVNTVNVKLVSGQVYSSTDDGVLAGDNLAIIGVDGRWELFQFRDAVLEADGTYTLSNFLRGLFGTEFAVGDHVAGDVFILVDSTALLRVDQSLADLGVALEYHALSIGSLNANVASIDFTNQDNVLRPYPVNYLAGVKQSNGDWVFTWTPRVRIAGSWMASASIPADAAIDGYQLDIMDGSTVKRSIYITGATTFTYPFAGQQEDFGGGLTTIKVRVYAYNADVGLGAGVEITAPDEAETFLPSTAFTGVDYTSPTASSGIDPTATTEGFPELTSLYFYGSEFLACASNGTGFWMKGSSDASTWTIETVLAMGALIGCHAGSYYGWMASGGTFGRSTTGADGSWTYFQRLEHPLRNIYGGAFNDMASSGSKFIACGNSGVLESTINFVTWTEHAIGTITNSATLSLVRYLNGNYIVHGIDSVGGTLKRRIWRSTDLNTWTDVTPTGFDNHVMNDAIYAGGKIVMVGYKPNQYNANVPAIWTSTDGGATWTEQTAGGSVNNTLGAVVHDGTDFIAVGARYRAISSDGVSWTGYDDTPIIWGRMANNGTTIVAQRYDQFPDVLTLVKSTDHGVNWTTIS